MKSTFALIPVLLLEPLPALQSASRDIVVYSGVPCVIAASLTAGREGAKVVLIEPPKHVGGPSTRGINTAESEHMLQWTTGGFADEFYRRLGKHHGTGQLAYVFESSVAEKVYLNCERLNGPPEF